MPQVRWSTQRGFFVENLLVVTCESVEDMIAVVAEGVANRRVASHAMNSDSSRSHSIFSIDVDSEIHGASPAPSLPRTNPPSFLALHSRACLPIFLFGVLKHGC